MDNINNNLNMLLKKLESINVQKLQSQLEDMINNLEEDNSGSEEKLKKVQQDFSNLSNSMYKLADFIDRKFTVYNKK